MARVHVVPVPPFIRHLVVQPANKQPTDFGYGQQRKQENSYKKKNTKNNKRRVTRNQEPEFRIQRERE